MGELAERFRKYFEIPENKLNAIKYFADIERFKTKWESKISEFLRSVESQDEFDNLMNRFVSWKTKRDNESLLTFSLFDAFYKLGEGVEEPGLFTSGYIKYRNWSAQLYIGQGSFYVFEKLK